MTHEVISDSRRRIKIPNAAIANGVRHMNPFQMLRAEGARFVLRVVPRVDSCVWLGGDELGQRGIAG